MLAVRDYRRDDAEAIVRLFYATVHTVNRRHYTAQQLAAWTPAIPDAESWHARMVTRCTLVMEEDGALPAFAELEQNSHLGMFYCRADVVGQGIGSKLYAALETRAAALGLKRIFVETSITAKLFFARQGFRVVKRRKVVRHGVTMANYEMDKSLVVVDC